MNLFWSRIYDVIIKSILAGENNMFNALKKTCIHNTNCFELFGYDILIDSDLKPWLVEINLSPSLAVESPLDLTIKSNLIADIMGMVGVKRFDRKAESGNKMKNRMKSYFNRGKSLNTKYSHILGTMKEKNNNFGGVFNFTNTNFNHNGNNNNYADTFTNATNP
jgi:Tubulin-tyrosine ligase family